MGDIAAATGKCASITYIDLSAAFASIHRWLATPPPASTEEIAYRLSTSGRSPAEIQQFVRAIDALDVWASFPPTSRGRERHHLKAFLRETLSCSWFRMSGLEEFVEAGSGTPAGSSLGDAMFILAFAGAMKAVTAELSKEGLLYRADVPPQGRAAAGLPQDACLEPALYMDDAEIPSIADAGSIEEATGRVATIARRILQEHWLTMNTSPGKSEVMFFFNGPGSARVRKQLLAERSPPAIDLGEPFLGRSIGIVSAYRHLGSNMHMSQSMQYEVTHRLSAARQTFGAIAWPFIRAPRVDTQTKLAIVRSCLLSKGLFQAGCWPILTSSEAARLHKGIIHIFASCVPNAATYAEDLSYDALLDKYALPAPAVMVLSCRLRLFLRVVRRAPPQLVGQLLLARPGRRSWLRAIEADFGRLAFDKTHSEVAAQFGYDSALSDNLSAIFLICRAARSKVRSALRVYTSDPANSKLSSWAPPRCARVFQHHPCERCGQSFASRQAVSVHRFRAHGVVPIFRAKVASPGCPCCLQWLWSRSRLIEHLGKGERCREFCARLDDLPPEVIATADEEEAREARRLQSLGLRRHTVMQPAVRAEGPLPLAAVQAGICHVNLLRTGRKLHA